MGILYEAQLLSAMKQKEREFMTLSSACHGDANWYTSVSQIINEDDLWLYS